jgi:heavy metal sensor kinase
VQDTAFHQTVMMKWFKNLRVRFAMWTSLVILIVMAIFATYIYTSMAHGLVTAIDNSLALNASQIASGLNIENGKLVFSDNLVESGENADSQAGSFTVRILSPLGDSLYENGSYQGLPILHNRSFTTYNLPNGGSSVRLYTQPEYDNSRLIAIVQVAQSLTDVQTTLHRLIISLLVSIPLLVVVAGASGYFLAARTLAPIDQITSTARRISARDLSQRINLSSVDDEVGRLAKTFDEMLARLDDSFHRERQFTNDASHELRTPLAAMQAILAVIREKQRKPKEYRQALDDLAEETDRLGTLIENMLLLARSDNQVLKTMEPVDLSALIHDVSDSMRPLAEVKQLTLVCETPPKIMVLGNSDDLIRLFVNLLDNAIKYTERGNITIQAEQEGESDVSVTVSDTGIGISAEHLPRIFDRFYRVDQSRVKPGTGLGLAIASDIVQSHHGTITARSLIGGGTSITVHFRRNQHH